MRHADVVQTSRAGLRTCSRRGVVGGRRTGMVVPAGNLVADGIGAVVDVAPDSLTRAWSSVSTWNVPTDYAHGLGAPWMTAQSVSEASYRPDRETYRSIQP